MARTLDEARGQSGVLPEPRALLRKHGMRCTPGRLRILSLLNVPGRHLTAAEIGARLTLSGAGHHPTTVYRTLETLTAAGVTHAVPCVGPTRYGITNEPHHHTMCERCGHVDDLVSESLTEAVRGVRELTGLRPGAAGSLLVHGLCSRCTH
ncbi:hypothetical protein ASR50_31655 [Streptomyces sp. 4F]|nr:hypothetical protein ASR50_31655 [Streptomyces sp. 4F]MBM4827148.1 transcriptional repressor [Actinospica acidiphila]